MEYIKAYSGNDSYIFISYAHKDTESVLPIIKNLINSGYRTWYDEGIEPGKDWDEFIANHVIGCSYFIAFVSHSYLASSNCMDELNFARDENKKLLIVYLSPVELPAGMRMRLNRLQAINKYTFENEANFYEKLFSADGINATRENHSDKLTGFETGLNSQFSNAFYTPAMPVAPIPPKPPTPPVPPSPLRDNKISDDDDFYRMINEIISSK